MDSKLQKKGDEEYTEAYVESFNTIDPNKVYIYIRA